MNNMEGRRGYTTSDPTPPSLTAILYLFLFFFFLRFFQSRLLSQIKGRDLPTQDLQIEAKGEEKVSIETHDNDDDI